MSPSIATDPIVASRLGRRIPHGCPVSFIATPTPINAKGTENMIVKGWTKLSKRAASTM